MKIIPLSEGAFTVGKSKEFIPFDIAHDDLQQRSTGSLLVEIQPFVVVTRNDVLLLDSGLGFEKDGELQLHQLMKVAGVDPRSVSKVLMSHLHKDHVGGMGKNLPDGRRVAAFPQAKYYIQRRELEYALEKGSPSYEPESFQFLNSFSNLVKLEGNGKIDDYIRYELTGGHCPFHQVFHLEEDGQHFFFGGDVAPQLSQMKNRFVAKYDYDGKKCMQLRQQWWEQGGGEGWTFLFYHDIKVPVFNVEM
ncbi:MAG: MBL fold metallo-hydrolase [Bacteroidota bacterium]|nr:MBL fold metallo-hydrolase [Bacteroidota bacterium]MDP4213260.1 MBL fold metallo-hydrolase [Bacteroidota bacterium]MDP4250327.1 MBL fold metallo-hydrolase [Bacteroidota bacterium]